MIAGQQQIVNVGNRTLAKTLASDDEDTAVDKRRFRDKCADLVNDFFGLTKYGFTKKEDVIRALWKVANPDTSVSLQNGVLHLAQRAEDPRKFANAFVAEEGKDEHESPAITIRLAGQHVSTVSFDREPEWDTFYFSKDKDKPIWRISEQAVQLVQVSKSENSVEFQSNLLACLATYPEQANNLTLKVETKDQCTLVTTSLFGKPVQMTFDGKVALDPILFTEKQPDTGEFTVNPIDFYKYRPVFTALYCSEHSEQELINAVLTDPAVQSSNNIKIMQDGENLSYQSAEFRNQVCRDLHRQRLNLSPDAERKFTHKVIQLFAPDQLAKLKEPAKLVYQDFCGLPIFVGKNERREMCVLLEDINNGTPQTDLTEHPHTNIITAFQELPEKQKEAFLAVARRNAEFSFKPDELKKDSSEFLSDLAQIASQGTLSVAAEMVRSIATMFDAKDSSFAIVQDQTLQQISQTNKPESKSELTHSWPVNVKQMVTTDGTTKTIGGPILEVSTHFEFDTLQVKKSPNFLNQVDEQVETSQSQIIELNKEIIKIDLEIKDETKKKQDEEEERQRIFSLAKTASPKKIRKMDFEKQIRESGALKDQNAVTMKMTSYDLKIKLAHPEVGHSAQRVIEENSSSPWLNMPALTVAGNLPASHNLRRETNDKTLWGTVQQQAEDVMTNRLLGVYYPDYY
jgi:hypothetical protein